MVDSSSHVQSNKGPVDDDDALRSLDPPNLSAGVVLPPHSSGRFARCCCTPAAARAADSRHTEMGALKGAEGVMLWVVEDAGFPLLEDLRHPLIGGLCVQCAVPPQSASPATAAAKHAVCC